MSAYTRLQQVYESANELPINMNTKIVIMSDCHRGIGNAADNFAKNKSMYHAALNHYYREGYSYIELGDGDELWENRSFPMIVNAHADTFKLLAKFHKRGRLHMIYGNHDMYKKKPAWVSRYLQGSPVDGYHNGSESLGIQLFPGMQVYDGLVLRRPCGRSILLLHGHQADFFNFRLWRLARFMVRYFWRPLELVGVQNPFDTPRRPGRRNMVERHLINWCKRENVILIAGHTHQPSIPQKKEPPYFNDGSCVARHMITCIEIEGDCISLVKWSLQPRRDGVLYVRRDLVGGRSFQSL